MKQMKQKRPEHRVTRALNDIMPKKKSEEKEQEDRNNAEQEGKEYDSDSDSDSDSEATYAHPDDELDFEDGLAGVNKKWKTKYKFRLSDVTLRRRVKDTCVITTKSTSGVEKTREVIFNDEDDALSFEQTLQKEQARQGVRDEIRFKAALGDIVLKDDGKEVLDSLIEIIGGGGIYLLWIIGVRIRLWWSSLIGGLFIRHVIYPRSKLFIGF
jgi:hypothetical protein